MSARSVLSGIREVRVLCVMTTYEDGTSAASVHGSVHVGSGSVRSSVSGATDVLGIAHKHVSPHIGQIDSGNMHTRYCRADAGKLNCLKLKSRKVSCSLVHLNPCIYFYLQCAILTLWTRIHGICTCHSNVHR